MLRIRGAILVALGLVVFFATVPQVTQVLMAPLQHREQPQQADVIIVLGGGLKKDGSVGKIVANRIREGLALEHALYSQTIFFSGGPVKSKLYTESVQMLDYATNVEQEKGVFFAETQSTSTRGNAEFSKIMMQEHNWNTALLVTSQYHELRACRTFRKLQINVICVPANASLGPKLTYWEQFGLLKGVIREYGATVYYWMRGYL